jgi:hypothetical protein
MNKLIVAFCASAFAFGSSYAMAQGNRATDRAEADSSLQPLSKMETQDAKAARVAAQAKWASMTPEQQAAARKAARQKKLSDATAMDMVATENMQYDTKQGAADAKASKAQPAPTKQERQQDSTTMIKTAPDNSVQPLPPKKQ